MDKRYVDRLLLRPVEAAEMLGVGRSKLYELIADGALPTVRIGRRHRVPIDALHRWVEQRASTGGELPSNP